MERAPSYLRAVLTRACPLRCGYCHGEGQRGQSGDLSAETLADLVLAGIDAGIRKVKLLGGEPLLRTDLPHLVGAVRRPGVDLSVISAGVVDPARLDAAFAAGLDRVNLTIHGWTQAGFRRKAGRGDRAWALRQRFLARLLEHGRPAKLNYVYTGPDDEPDIAALLDQAARWPVVVNVLDDLGNPDLGPGRLVRRLVAMRGRPARLHVDPDPHSLDTLHLTWSDGLEVEVKHRHLGEIAPWAACAACSRRAGCREGIYAVRLGPDGVLRPCMDRPDLGWPLLPLLRAGGRPAVAAAWRERVAVALRPAGNPAGVLSEPEEAP